MPAEPVASDAVSQAAPSTAPAVRHVAVVGGGVAGLSTAWFLRTSSPDVRVTVLDGADRLGGKLRTVELCGLPVDTGAEAMLNRRPEAVDLAQAVGLAGLITYPETTRAGLWSRGRIRPIPPGTVMGVPADLEALTANGVVSAEGVARAELDRTMPPLELRDDVAIGGLVAERLGREVVDRLVEPLLGGVYAGHADRLSLQATVPQLARYARTERSLLRAAERAQEAARDVARNAGRPAGGDTGPSSDVPVFAGLDGGVGSLIPALAAASRAIVRTGAMVRELARTPSGWRLVIGPTAAAEALEADAVVLACPAGPAARLLSGVAPHAAAGLAAIEYASLATVALAYPAAAVPPAVAGSGFLVPPVEGRLIKAATYSSLKWGWLGSRAARDGLVVVRCSIGRHGDTAELQRDDAELVAGAVADLAAAVGLSGRPVAAYVQRWGGALPQYAVGHRNLVDRVRAEVARLPGLALAGAAYDGVGIPACVATAQAATTQVLASDPALRRMTP